MDNAEISTLALANALQNTPGIDLGITMFPGDTNWARKEGMPETVYPVLRHGQSSKIDPSRFFVTVGGGTPLDSSLWYVAQQIEPLKHRRKIVLVLTDGEPNDGLRARHIINLMTDAGYEVYGIGIESASVSNLFKTYAVISNVNQLPQAMDKILRQAFTAARRDRRESSPGNQKREVKVQRVFVLDSRKQPLMPCHPARARELLRSGKAAVFRRYPFTKKPAEKASFF